MTIEDFLVEGVRLVVYRDPKMSAPFTATLEGAMGQGARTVWHEEGTGIGDSAETAILSLVEFLIREWRDEKYA